MTRVRRSPRHVCFVAPAAWPVLAGDRSIRSVGGAEAQQSILARALVARGFRVSMVCMNFGQPERTVVDGIEVYRAHSPDGGIPILRFLHPRLTSIWTAMARADADIYYQRSSGALTGIVASFCRVHDKKFVYAAAHDADFDSRLPLIRLHRDRALYVWGLRRADAVVVQNQAQQLLCRNTFGLGSRRIPSCYSLPIGGGRDPKGYVLWVSTMRAWKRPELFVELAAKLPQFRFRMVGGPEDAVYYDDLRRRAASLTNLEFTGFIPYADIEAQFNGARIFVNTSESEGFPNTFLQSWARGIPTVSFFDVGAVMSGTPVVQIAQSFEDMVCRVEDLMSSEEAWQVAGAHSFDYFARHHSRDGVADIYERLIDEVSALRSGQQPRVTP